MKVNVKILTIMIAGILAGTLLAPAAHAQSGQGTVSGKVIGRDGMPLANAILRIDRMNSQNALQRIVAQRFDAKTGKNGSYSVNGLPPGSYVVTLFENGAEIMVFGDKTGDTVIVNNTETFVNFDMRKAPAPIAPAAAAVAPVATKANLEADRKALEEAAKNKNTVKKSFELGLAAYKAQNYEEAVTQFQSVVAADPKQDVAFANLGNALKEVKKYDESAAAYKKAIELKPMEAAYQNNLALSLGAAGKMDEAKAAFETAAKLDPKRAGEFLYNEAAMYNNNQDYPKAMDAFRRTLEADPNNKGAMLQLAISYFSTPETMVQAEPLLKKFLTLNPTPGDAETANAFLAAIHDAEPKEFKSDKALADEKKAADAAAKSGQKGKAPAGKSPK
jgi:tetratricopeptide (TPR) repeat protein